jgi:hypothetical protein
MIAERVTPRVVLIGLTLTAGAWLGLHLPVLFGGAPHRQDTGELYFFAVTSAFGYALAFLLNLEIAGEYRHDKVMRLAWLFIAANAGFSIIRETIGSPLPDSVWPGHVDSPLWGLQHQVVITLANVSLVVGLLGMWWAYQRVGLGLRAGRRQYVEIGIIVVLTLALVLSREGMTEADSPYLVSRLLQPLGLVVLSVAAAASVVLYGMAVQMGGGRLAVALRCLTLYTILRATLVLLEAILSLTTPERRQVHDLMMTVDLLLWRAVPWILALAAAYRAELTVHAKRELARQRATKADPLPV